MGVGDVCRARCGAPARYIGGGRCLFVSATGNDLSTDVAAPPGGDEGQFPLPTDQEIARWTSVAFPGD